MLKINSAFEPKLFNQLVQGSKATSERVTNLRNIGTEQKDILLETIAKNINESNPEVTSALSNMLDKLAEGKVAEAFDGIRGLLPKNAAIKETSLGTSVMADNWAKPVIFPKDSKMLGWVDNPKMVTTEDLWSAAYGEKPAHIFGSVGNSNIKPEQVRGGSSLSKKELSQKYEDAIVDFYAPIVNYLKENGAKTSDIGFAFAHSDCGVDKAARQIVEQHNLKGFATTPTEYTQYLRGTEIPPSEEFPNGAILADFPFPSVLTRGVGQIEDYANVYGKMVGKNNVESIFGGGEHAFIRDARESLVSKDGANWIPVDIMKDKFGITIPATDEKGVVTNAAANVLERVNANPYEQYKYAFKNYLPESKLKNELAQYDPQAAVATIAYTNLAKAGKIDKI